MVGTRLSDQCIVILNLASGLSSAIFFGRRFEHFFVYCEARVILGLLKLAEVAFDGVE